MQRMSKVADIYSDKVLNLSK